MGTEATAGWVSAQAWAGAVGSGSIRVIEPRPLAWALPAWNRRGFQTEQRYEECVSVEPSAMSVPTSNMNVCSIARAGQTPQRPCRWWARPTAKSWNKNAP
jgi:hypothetical protein